MQKVNSSKGLRIMGVVISIVVAFVLIFGSMLFILSPGKPEPYIDENGKPLANSISEKVFVNINGVKQVIL